MNKCSLHILKNKKKKVSSLIRNQLQKEYFSHHNNGDGTGIHIACYCLCSFNNGFCIAAISLVPHDTRVAMILKVHPFTKQIFEGFFKMVKVEKPLSNN